MDKFEIAKESAAVYALKFVTDKMTVGLGTGSTSNIFIEQLAKINRDHNTEIIGVPTSTSTAILAKRLGFKISTIDEVESLDIVFDGADEVDVNLNMIKGGGGALLQEKIVAKSAGRFIALVDESKKVKMLGKFPLPVEIVKFGYTKTIALINEYLSDTFREPPVISIRTKNGENFVSDEGHFILDLFLGKIANPKKLDIFLNTITGVVETGIFVDIADVVVIGRKDGSVKLEERWK